MAEASLGYDETELKERRRQQLRVAMVARDPADLEPLRTAAEAAREAGLPEAELRQAGELLRRLESETAPLTFTDLPQQEVERLQQAASREEVVAILMQYLGLSPDHGFQTEVLAEFHYHVFMFGQRLKFSAEKVSTLVSVMRQLHTSSIVEDRLEESKAHELLDLLLRRHSRQLPPMSFGAFTEEEAQAVREFAEQHFFRYYAMHNFIFTQQQEVSISLSETRAVPAVLPLAPLHASFEVDPREVPELQELIFGGRTTGQDAGGNCATEGQMPSLEAVSQVDGDGTVTAANTLGGNDGNSQLTALAPSANNAGGATSREVPAKMPQQDEVVSQTIDAVIAERLGPLHARLELPPPA